MGSDDVVDLLNAETRQHQLWILGSACRLNTIASDAYSCHVTIVTSGGVIKKKQSVGPSVSYGCGSSYFMILAS